MKKLISILVLATVLISCNKEESRVCDCTYTTEKQIFDHWYVIYDDNTIAPIVNDTLVNCDQDGQIIYLEEYNNLRRQVISCK